MAQKQWTVYKTDNWNMIKLALEGNKYIISEISSVYGEDRTEFKSRNELRQWAERYFSAENWKGSEEERKEILTLFKKV